MRFIIVSQHFFPDVFRVNDIAFALREQGHEVRVITGLPDYDAGTVPPAYRRFRKRRETVRGVEVVRLPTSRRRAGPVWRLLNYASFAIEGWLYACFARRGDRPADAVITYQTSPVSQAMPAIRLGRRFGCPHILYCLDLWPESMKVWHVRERSALYRAVSAVSGRISRAADRLAVCSRPFERYLTETHGVDSARLRYLPQHCETLFEQVAGRYEENGVFDFVFAGNVGGAQDLPCVLRAAALLRDAPNLPPFHIHIVGGGSELDAVRGLSAELGLEALVTFHGRKPLEQMPEYYRLADAFLLTLTGDSFVGQTLPGKLQSYMSAGKPVVAAIGGAAAEVLAEADCGLCAPASDAEGLARRMAETMTDVPAARVRGENGRAYYQRNFRQEVFLSRLLSLVREARGDSEATPGSTLESTGGSKHV